MGDRWTDQPWADPEVLIADLEKLYTAALREKRITSPQEVAARKIQQARGWAHTPFADILRAVTETETVYIPKGVGPGPGICFPIRDCTREIRRMHIRLLGDGPETYRMNYMSLVHREHFVGPAWVGDDDATLDGIIQCGEVLLVEGPMDLLAVRATGCGVPSLSSTSKKVTPEHWDYLRMLAVEHIYVMFDNETSRVGEKAALAMTKNPHGIKVTPVTCPAKDPAESLKTPTGAARLKTALDLGASTFTPLDD